ncbi:Multidrug resistance protein pgp-3 [Aphelenchoides fujianensis]|nr:Multidrug resistance protein pgp-3 [Aphelenchoides fujianensis]
MPKAKIVPPPLGGSPLKSPPVAREEEKKTLEPASFFEMMRYAERFDWILLAAGIGLSVVHGCLPACNMLIFRGITETLIHAQQEVNEERLDLPAFTRSMLLYISLYLAHGIVTCIIGYCSVTMGKRTFPAAFLSANPKSKRFDGPLPPKSPPAFEPPPQRPAEPATFREMLRYATRFDWVLLGGGIVLSAVHGFLEPAEMFIFRGITHSLMFAQKDFNEGRLEGERMAALTRDVVFYVCFYLLHGLAICSACYLSTACFFTLSERQTHRIKKEFLRTVMNQDQPWFEQNNVGKLAEKMNSGIDRIRDGTGDKLQAIIQASVSLIAGLAISLWMSWRMAFILIAVNPFVMANLIGSAKTTKAALQRAMAAYGDAANVAEEVLYGIRTTQACNAQPAEIRRYSRFLQIGCTNGVRRAMFTALFSGLHLLLLFGAMGYGTVLVLEQGLEPGNVYAVFWAALGGAMRLGNAIPQISVILSAKLCAAELFAIIDRKPAFDCTSESGVKPERIDGRIEFKGVCSRYPSRPDVPILRDVSFSIEKGTTVGIVGHSGCGKSTLFSLLMRMYDYESGKITIDGVSVRDLNVEWLRNAIGIVSQDPVVFAGTIADNLRMGRVDATMDEMIAATRQANAEEFIRKLPDGINTRLGEGGVRLSGGQRQRLVISRVLLRNPKILLLDEATSALDTESERQVQAAIEQAATGRTTLIVAHRLATVRNVDRLLVFDGGRIVETGTHDELMEKGGVYRRLVEAQEIEQIGEQEMEDVELEGDSGSPKSGLRRRSSASRRSSLRKNGYKQFQNNGVSKKETIEEAAEAESAPSASLAQIFRAARPEHPLIFCGLIATVIRGVSWPVFSIIYGRLFNSLTEALNHRKTADFDQQNLINGVSFGVLGVVACVCTFLSGYLFGMTGERLTMRLRTRVFTVRSVLFIESTRMVSLASGLGIGFYFDWHLAPIATCTAFLIVGTQLILTNYMKRRGFKDAEIAEEAARISAEAIEHVKTVQSLTRQSLLYERYCECAERPHKRAIKRGLLQSISFGLTSSYFSIHFAFAYLFGLLFIRMGLVTPFVVFQVIEAVTMASFTVMMAATYFPEYIKARVAAGFIFHMMEAKPKIDSNSEAGCRPPINGHLQLKDVYFAYPNAPKHLVLNGVNIEALEGKTVAIVGPSGCGKSTIIQLLERYYDCLSGQVTVDSTDLRQLNLRHVRERMALVAQENAIFNISLADNIAYGMEGVSHDRIVAAARQANIADFIESLPEAYQTIAGSRGAQLSGGQKQRLAIARAVCPDPKILLLDEATSALDTQSEKIVQEALDKAQEGRTVVVIAHRLSTIVHSDLIVVVNEGRVAEMGTHQELLALNGIYRNLIDKQSA